jgi:hypothetical protein
MPDAPISDTYGYGRIPAFWYTLNLPFNHLHEIHRFHDAVASCTSSFISHKVLPGSDNKTETSPPSETVLPSVQELNQRCAFVLDNPDIVATIHAIRVELNVRYVMSVIVPTQADQPFQFWLRFEWGKDGNPHTHGQNWVPNNPYIDKVYKDSAAHDEYEAAMARNLYPDQNEKHQTIAEAESTLSNFFKHYVCESHPSKDANGDKFYDFDYETLTLPHCQRPHTTNLFEALSVAFQTDPPDLTKIKELLLALIENGQRHTGHGHNTPKLGQHACARKGSTSQGEDYVFCRYL